jgi:hypothetical protein
MRIPNELIIKKAMTNASYFDQKRLTFFVSLSMEQDSQTMIDMLTDCVREVSVFAGQPVPIIMLYRISQANPGDAGPKELGYQQIIRVQVWTDARHENQAHSAFLMAVRKLFISRGIPVEVNLIVS